MKKIVLSVMAACSLAFTSTMAVAAPSAATTVSTPLTQPAVEKVAGDNQFVGVAAIGAVFGVFVAATFVSVIVFAVKSSKNHDAPVRTSP